MPQRSGCSLGLSFLCVAVREMPIPPGASSSRPWTSRTVTRPRQDVRPACRTGVTWAKRRAAAADSDSPSRRLAYAFCTEPARGRRPCGDAPGAASDGARPCVHAPALRTGVLSARASDAQRLLLCAGWSRRRAIADVSGELCLRYGRLPANDPPLQAPWLLPPSVRPMRTEDVSRRGERE